MIPVRFSSSLGRAPADVCVPCGIGLRWGPETQPAQTEPEQLEVDFIQEAVWSPSGDRLLAAWHQGGRYRLYGVPGPESTDSALEPGSGLRVSDGPDLADGFAPRPSPDGRWLAFVRGEWPTSALYALDLGTGGERRLTR